MGNKDAIKVAILWHMHQPNYQEPWSNSLVMPWVRLHALKDYLDMPLLAVGHENVKVTFNLVPCLLEQFQVYLDGGSDRYLDLSRLPAGELSKEEKTEIVESLFCGHPPELIEPYRRYRELYYQSGAGPGGIQTSLSESDFRDIQVWSNLSWIDPMFRREEPIRQLFDKGRDFTEEEKQRLLDWQIELISRIVPTYRDLFEQGQIDISFTPYYHPILPLLCDSDIALEAMPGATLPRDCFRHPEDAEHQVKKSVEMFADLFGGQLEGMWPSEGSVSEEVLELIHRHGVRWVATDEGILAHSLAKSNMDQAGHPIHATYQYGSGIRLLFRDRALSDRVGFVYSGWEPERAADDFIDHLLRIKSQHQGQLDARVISVILDGENAWEYFRNDGHDFLNALYERLGSHPEIETVFMREAASLEAETLPRIFAGSWINHNFRIWIGHPEDNAAWDLLSSAREQLVSFEAENPEFDAHKIEAAWKQIYVAEGSDWCWWYGDEHRGKYNAQFDSLFRRHLQAVYEILVLEVPLDLLSPIYGGGMATAVVNPTSMLTAQIDGRLTHYYEWTGAGYFDCLKAGGSMHRVDRLVSSLQFAYDHDRIYIRLDFANRKGIKSIERLKVKFCFYTPEPVIIELAASETGFAGVEPGRYRFALDDILELALERSAIWPCGYGSTAITVSLFMDDQALESWPENEPIKFDVPEKGSELFWPT